MAEHTSWRNPGSVSSAVRVPPPIVSCASMTRTERPAWASVTAAARPFGPAPITTASSVPTGNARRLLARDHAAPESTLALSKADQPCCGRVRPLAWCSRPRDSAASPAGPLMPRSFVKEARLRVDPKRARIREIIDRLAAAHPDATIALRSRSPLELLVAVMLSAQTTDVNVNRVTERLFGKYRKPEDYLAVPPEELERDIFATGFYRQKAKSLRGTMA